MRRSRLHVRRNFLGGNLSFHRVRRFARIARRRRDAIAPIGHVDRDDAKIDRLDVVLLALVDRLGLPALKVVCGGVAVNVF